VRMNRVEDR